MGDYMAWCEQRALRPRYIEEIHRTLTRLQREVGRFDLLEAAELKAWFDSMTIAASTRNVYMAHLSGFYQWAQRTSRRPDNPCELLVRPRQIRRLPRPIPDERLKLALGHAQPPLDAWLSLACYMGLRAHEIAMLHGEDIIGDRLLVRDGKGGRQRVLPLHPDVVPLLNAPYSGPIWHNCYGGELTANTVSHRANRYLHDLDIPETLHQLRHWFGTTVYQTSRDLRLTQELMGHASPLTTAGYAAWNSDAAANAVARIGLTA